jgi:hypothetical protein
MQTEVRQANGKITFYIFNKDFSVFTMKKKNVNRKSRRRAAWSLMEKGKERKDRHGWG